MFLRKRGREDKRLFLSIMSVGLTKVLPTEWPQLSRNLTCAAQQHLARAEVVDEQLFRTIGVNCGSHHLQGSCAVPWWTSAAIRTTTTNKLLIFHCSTATEEESVQRRNVYKSHTMVAQFSYSAKSRFIVNRHPMYYNPMTLLTHPITTTAPVRRCAWTVDS